jgi:O-acetyl-ADP-ribose deacetylase (regulator of RNase III)
MIRFVTGDILQAPAEALVNTVNCVGVMGRGVALQFKQAYPDNFAAYAAACARGDVRPGSMFVHRTNQVTGPRWIVNFPTKRHWRGRSRLDDIDAGLAALRAEVVSLGIRSIAVPPLGSGLGGLDWGDVRPRIERALSELGDVEVLVYEPLRDASDRRPNPSTPVPRMTPGRAALVCLVDRYLGGLMDPSVSLLEVHKLMYFMQRSGEGLRLAYVRGPYGPYAENLRHVLRAVDGHLLSGYADGGDAPDKQLELVPGASLEAASFLTGHAQTQRRFERVSRLVEGYETPFGLELLATVDWVIDERATCRAEAVVEATWEWSPRKRQFSRRQIEGALARLIEQGWVRQPAVKGA